MPSIFSKNLSARLLGSEWSFGYNCYEVGHTWTPSCTHAAFEISMAAGSKVLPLYTMLYIFSQVAVQRKYDIETSWETVKSIFRSSFFIFFHAYNGSVLGCALRRGFGRFYYRVLVCAPALLSSYISLLIEKPSRRQALAFYMLNLASEIVYRMAVTKGYFKPVKHGETLLFAVSLSFWYHLIKTHGFGHDPVSSIVKLLIGRDEAKSRTNRKQKLEDGKENYLTVNSNSNLNSNSNKKIESHIKIENEKKHLQEKSSNDIKQTLSNASNYCDKLIDSVGIKYLDGKHTCCPHREASCLNYIISPMPSRFLLGFSIQTLLKLAAKPHLLLKSPAKAITEAIYSKGSLKFGLFLLSLVSSGRLTSCLLRRYSNSNQQDWHAAVSGFVAGLSMLLAPRSSISMYIMWKAVEQYYLLAAKQGRVKYFDFTILTIYAASAATILYTFALEPKFVRPSYMKFLDNLSDHRLHQLNRMVLDVFGTGSSVGYEDYFPDLDPKFMSNQFKELVFNWMIQPYE